MKLSDVCKSLCIALPILSASCTNFCQDIADWGAEYDGVEKTKGEVYYRHGGKKYLKGHRAKFRRTYVQNPFLIAKPTPERYEMKPGTMGEEVYSELRADKDGCLRLVDGSDWKPLKLKDTRAYPMGENMVSPWPAVNSYSRKLTPHAIYAYPLATATFACVDVPLNIAGGAVFVGFASGVLLVSGVGQAVMWCLPEQQQPDPNGRMELRQD